MGTTFGDGACVIHKHDVLIATGSLDGTLYVIQSKPTPANSGRALISSLRLWHERIAHVEKRGIAQMADRGVVHGLKITERDVQLVCNGCAIPKACLLYTSDAADD